jgi:aminopeptidase N
MNANRWLKPGRVHLLVLILAACCRIALSQEADTRQSPLTAPQGIHDQVIHDRGVHDFDVQHYRIAVEFDLPGKAVGGEVTINLKASATDLKEVTIDAGRMTINSVTLNHKTPLKFTYEDGEKLRIRLDRSYPAGSSLAVTVGYRARPTEGLTFIGPDGAARGRAYQVWSHGQTRKNHYWFPCQDQIDDKATTEMIATVADRYQVISNGSLLGVRPGAGKRTRIWHWKMDRPYSTYLVSVVVGEFAEVKDRYKKTPITSYVPKNRLTEGKLSFSGTARMMDFFAKKTGVDYPYSKYAQTTVSDFNGGMENITATTLTDTIICDKQATLDFTPDDLVSHELSHSWFGNLVTCAGWGELWLNEGFATFMSNLWTEHEKGKDDYLYSMFLNQQQYLRTWFQGNRRPVILNNYSDPDQVFDVYSYQRGAAVLDMLRFVLGEETFWKSINHYLHKHQWQNVKTDDLIVAIKESTGQDVRWFFDEWVYKMGHPEFDVNASYDVSGKLKLTVKQTQKSNKAKYGYDSPEFFTMPVDIGITTASGEKVHRVWIDKAEKEFTFDVDSKPLIINFDRGNRLIKLIRFKQSKEDLAYQLLHDADAMGRVWAAIRLRADKSDATVKALSDALRQDRFWGVRAQAVSTLGQVKTEAARAALLEAVKDKDTRVRSAAIQGLAGLRDSALADLFTGLINNDESLFAIAEACRALGQTQAPQAYDVLVGTLARPSWQDTIRVGALEGLIATGDSRALDVAIKYAQPGKSTSVRLTAFNLMADKGKADERVRKTLTAAMKESSLPVRLAAISNLGAIGDARAIPQLEELTRSSDQPPSVIRAASEAINQLKNLGKGNEVKH